MTFLLISFLGKLPTQKIVCSLMKSFEYEPIIKELAADVESASGAQENSGTH
jgi:hypothetical protein